MSRPKSKTITQREYQVLEWMYFGKTNIEIGLILAISELTVKNHVASLCARLGVLNRTRVVTCALERGYLQVKETA